MTVILNISYDDRMLNLPVCYRTIKLLKLMAEPKELRVYSLNYF